ncbi:replication stress response regulator SDE2 isoform X1 [Kryptolebias marmoratus]|uniref:replication stress response regulator SDE2 isoform X1 n=1 Tax=Kryptolebias marmoratus TaxID=37003 RepID=UPI0018AC92D7|nr:replication stress response regulator SDE2 isoform X1 [Kryptolebias marmoratus]
MRSQSGTEDAKMEVFVVTPGFRCSSFVFSVGSRVGDVLDRFVPQQDFYVTSNGRLSQLEDPLQHGSVYHLEPRLCGGKGGFGSMLRALGAQIEKTTNREACRDLSGRRLRDVNHEKEMAEWLKKQAEREAEKEQRRLERLQRKLAEPKHQFTDPEYQQQCHDLSERLEDSVLKGLQASSSCQVTVSDASASKRPNATESGPPKKKKMMTAAAAGFWTGLDDLDELSSEEDEESPSTSAVTMTIQREEAEPEPSSSTGLSQDQRPELLSEKQEPSEPESSSTQQLDLSSLTSVQQLESLGLDVLKEELISRGLKCGGTLSERAARLFSVRGLSSAQIDPVLLAKPVQTKK